MQDIVFRDSDHSYWEGDIRYSGVNTTLGNFGFEFRSDFWLAYKAFAANINGFGKRYYGAFGGDYNIETDELIEKFEPALEKLGKDLAEEAAKIQDQWTAKAQKGTDFHADQELKCYMDGFCVNPFDGKKYDVVPKREVPEGFDNVAITELKDLEDGAHMELVVFNRKYKIAGQADEAFIETIDGVRYVDIGDHKTNAKMPKLKLDNGTCLPPIDHVADCTYMKYVLQLSMYCYLLELEGFVPRNIGIYWYKDFNEKTRKVLPFKYLREECKAILEYQSNFF